MHGPVSRWRIEMARAYRSRTANSQEGFNR
jgi:hypothetical protein